MNLDRIPLRRSRRLLAIRLDGRFFGPQVPGDNPVHWIAERAPPRTS